MRTLYISSNASNHVNISTRSFLLGALASIIVTFTALIILWNSQSNQTNQLTLPIHLAATTPTITTAMTNMLLRSQAPQQPPLQLHNIHCPLKQTNGFARIILATVPRSGNHFIRYILERVTGISTESVYASETAGGLHGTDSLQTFSNRTKAYGGCRMQGLACVPGIHRSRESEPVVIKTHFPYHFPTFKPEEEPVDLILTTVRNPYDNYLAWIRADYIGTDLSPLGKPIAEEGSSSTSATTKKSLSQITSDEIRSKKPFKTYLRKWIQHHLFWRKVSKQHCVKLVELSYDRLLKEKDKILYEMFQHLPFRITSAGGLRELLDALETTEQWDTSQAQSQSSSSDATEKESLRFASTSAKYREELEKILLEFDRVPFVSNPSSSVEGMLKAYPNLCGIFNYDQELNSLEFWTQEEYQLFFDFDIYYYLRQFRQVYAKECIKEKFSSTLEQS